MSTQLIWARIKSDVVCNGREFHAGAVVEITPAEFRQLVSRHAAVPCGERGRAMTSAAIAADMQTSRRAAR